MPESGDRLTSSIDLAGVRGVIFDLDGTLVDSYSAITTSLNAARSRFSLPPLSRDTVRRRVGHGLEQLVHDLVGADHVEEGVRVFRECYARVYAEQTSALPGVGETLRVLRERGFALAVASNKPARFGSAILESLGWETLFAVVEGPDTAGTTKPEPTMICRCLQTLGLTPDETLYVGDMVLDVETARRAGLTVVLVPGGSSGRSALVDTGRPLLEDFASLLDVLPASVGGSPQ